MAPRGGGAKIVLSKKLVPLVNYSFLCMLEFGKDCCQWLTKLSSHCKVRTYPLAQQLWRLKSDHIQSMQNAGIDEVTARATDNAEKKDIPNQLPKKRKKRASRQKMKELILHPSKSLAMNFLKCMSFSAWFSGIRKLRECRDDFNCVISCS